MNRKYLIGSLLFLMLSCNKYSKLQPSAVLADLKFDQRTSRTLFFYPSILRVINLQEHPAYYDLVENIEKIIVYRLEDSFTSHDADSIKTQLETSEAFEEYANLSLKGSRMYLLGKEQPSHMVFMIDTESNYYIADVLGQIDFLGLNQIMKLMSEDQEEETPQFLDVFSLMEGREKTRGTDHEIDSNTVIIPNDTLTIE